MPMTWQNLTKIFFLFFFEKNFKISILKLALYPNYYRVLIIYTLSSQIIGHAKKKPHILKGISFIAMSFN